MKAKHPSLTQLQDALVAKLVHGRNRYQGLACRCYEKQAVQLGYSSSQVAYQIEQCYQMADLLRNAR